MGMEIVFSSVVIGSTLAIMTNVLPINSIAGFGTIEAGWTVGYMMLGFDRNIAIFSAFLVHFCILFCALFYGLLGYLYQFAADRKKGKYA